MSEVMDMYALLASEYNMYLPDSAPIYHLMYLASTAEKRRNDRIKAAQDGRTYCG